MKDSSHLTTGYDNIIFIEVEVVDVFNWKERPVKSTNGRWRCLNLKQLRRHRNMERICSLENQRHHSGSVRVEDYCSRCTSPRHNLSLCVHYYLPIYPPPPKDTQSPGSQLLVISCWRYAGVIPLTAISTGRQDLTFKRRK